MRRTQYMGLNDRAKSYIKDAIREELSGETYTGLCSEVYELVKYTLPDNSVLFERLQAEPWSSVPCPFFALQRADGSWLADSLWTDAEMAIALGDEVPVPIVNIDDCASG